MDAQNLARQIGDLTKTVNDINKKLEDIPLIKSAILQLLGLTVVTNSSSRNVVSQSSVENSFEMEKEPVTSFHNVSVNGAVDGIKVEPCGYSDENEIQNGFMEVEKNLDGKIDDHSAYTEKPVVIPIIATSSEGILPRGLLISQATQTSDDDRLVKKKVSFNTAKEKNMLYNIHILFGIQACEKYFNVNKKRITPVITNYRIQKNISLLEQLDSRARLRSIADFDKKIIEYANDRAIIMAEDQDYSGLVVLSTDDPDYEIEYACEVVTENEIEQNGSKEDEFVGISHDVDNDSRTDAEESSKPKKRNFKMKKYNDKWYILQYPSVIECMKSEYFVDDILKLYFDERECDRHPQRIFRERLRRTGADRLSQPKRMRRQNFTQEELEEMQKMVSEKSVNEAAKHFQTTARSLQGTLNKLKRSKMSNSNVASRQPSHTGNDNLQSAGLQAKNGTNYRIVPLNNLRKLNSPCSTIQPKLEKL